eukprot:GFUD01050100.1.p1 GENE.GFUD01050100.1~~GFUD01050100.1.p1  ORF type:complete len:395 (-),score=137.56 GFUD01050100.1:102-1286(-)
MGVKIFVTLECPDTKTSARQTKIISILNTFTVPHILVDLSAKDRERGDQKEFMKAKAKKREGQETALPPQIFNSGKYCGDYEDFRIAYEEDTLDTFLGVSIRRPENLVIGTTYLEEEGEAVNDISDLINIPLEIEERIEAETVGTKNTGIPTLVLVTEHEEPYPPNITVRDKPEAREDVVKEPEPLDIKENIIDTTYLAEETEAANINDLIKHPLEIEEEITVETVEEIPTDNAGLPTKVTEHEEPYPPNITVRDEPQVREDATKLVKESEPLDMKENVIDTAYLEEETKAININDLIKHPLEIEEEIAVETVEEIPTDNAGLPTKVFITEEPKPPNITVVDKPTIEEDVIRHVREPEPLKMRPRKEPEPDTKPKIGKISQSVHMMLAYQSLYN